MKLAVYHQLPSGGGKRALYEMLQRLSKKHDVTLFTHRDCEEYLNLTKLVNKVVWLDAFPNPKQNPSLISKVFVSRQLDKYEAEQKDLAAAIDAGGFDVAMIHPSKFIQSPSVLHYLRTPSLYYSQEIRRTSYERRLRDQVIGTGSRAAFIRNREHKITQLDSRNICAATHVCVNSFHSAEAHKRAHGIEVEVVYLGVEPGSAAGKVSKKSSTIKLLNVGGMEPFKNQLRIVEALQGLGGSSRKYELHFVFDRSDADYLSRVKAAAHEIKLPVHFYKNISDTKLTQLYRQSNLTLCVADLEPFGLTPLESLAQNTPVVALKEGGYRETVVDGENGSFAQSLSAEDLGAAIERAVTLQPTTTNMRGVVVRSWNWQKTLKQLESSLSKVAKQA